MRRRLQNDGALQPTRSRPLNAHSFPLFQVTESRNWSSEKVSGCCAVNWGGGGGHVVSNTAAELYSLFNSCAALMHSSVLP